MVGAWCEQARQLDLYSGNDIVTAGQLDWDRIAAETADNDFAAAFLVLAGRLGLTE